MNCGNLNATVSAEAFDEDDEDMAHGMNEYMKSPIPNACHRVSIGHQTKVGVNDAEVDSDVEEVHTDGNDSDKSKTNSIYYNQHNLRMSHGTKFNDRVNKSLERLRRPPGIYNKNIIKVSVSPNQSIKPNSIKFQNEDGLIKKITITNSKSIKSSPETRLNLNTKIIKVKEPIPSSSSDDKLTKQHRTNTHFSREYIALQKSVNESKVLTEFVTDASVVKTRKLRKKQPTVQKIMATTTTSSSDHSYSSTDLANKKRQRDKRLAPVKDESMLNNASKSATTMTDSGLGLSSHSPSMYNNFSDNSNSNSEHKKRCKSLQKYDSDSSIHSTLNKWPSDEILISGSCNMKRTNMRSENSEFVQKQKEFLQQVKTSTQNTLHGRSRSRSVGVDSFDDSGNGMVGNSNETKTLKSKERTSKRLQVDIDAAEEDDQPLLSSTNETLESISLNTSINSVSTANTSSEVDVKNVDNLELLLKNENELLPPPRKGSDNYCWKCHASQVNLSCSKCIRSYHSACAKAKVDDMDMWICPECITLDNILNNTKRSRHNELSLDLLSQLLSFAIKRIRYAKGNYSFRMQYEDYNTYKRIIVNPITFDKLQAKVEAKEYRCVDEFVNDMKWMLHNAHILAFGNNTKLITDTKTILKICRQEANEIETCAECYLKANTNSDWFVDVCSQPHLLLWAKLKGFPYWPAKAMGLGPPGLVKVKFFGEHDRAFVPIKDCYLYSSQDPNTQTGKRAARELADCIKEVGEHIERIEEKVGDFCYAPFKILYDPNDEMRQLENMMPGVQDFIKRQHGTTTKPSLQFKIYKTADNNMSIIQKDLSTGEMSSGPSQENDELAVVSGSQKKKKSFSPTPLVGSHEKNGEPAVSKPPPKYEVILKVSSDDSNSSKLSPVILKRKSNNSSEAKQSLEEEVDGQHCTPKTSRMEETSLELSTSSNSLKRKLDSTCLEKPKVKHSKFQEKVPIVSIKRLTAQKDDNGSDTDKKINIGKSSNSNLQLNEFGDSQKSEEESLVKKQSDTTKKIPKSHTLSSTPSAPSASKAPNASTDSSDLAVPSKVQSLQSQTVALKSSKLNDNIANTSAQPLSKEKTEEQDRQNAVNYVGYNLKPFVEVKKEIYSDSVLVDNREEPEKCVKALTKEDSDKPNMQNKLNIVTQSSPEKDNTNKSCNEISNENLLTHVKQEILSDDDDEIDDNAPLLPELSQINSGQSNKVVNTNNPADVRVVGETVIKRLILKTTAIQQANNSSIQTSKRNTLKGIPYGPLPASALPKTRMQIDNVAINARTKKSYAVTSPPFEGLAAITTTNVSNSNLTKCVPTNQTVATPRLPLSRTTTMVAIPVDLAPNQNTSGMAPTISSIPVPPLTAVSKMLSLGNAPNSIATTNTSVIAVSGGTGSVPTTTHVPYNPLTTTSAASAATSMTTSSSPLFSHFSSSFTIAARKSPLTSALTTTTCISSMAVATRISPPTTISFNNRPNLSTALVPLIAPIPKQPLTMSTPPPLAGLSGSNFNNPIVPNVTTAVETIFTTPSLTTSTIAIVSAKRGPPKLVSRPRGPLQYEGQSMCNSQAGPVSKTLMENAHKITDYFISVMEDTISDIAQGNEVSSLQARVVLLEKELERTKQSCEQQLSDLRRSFELMRTSMENEKTRLQIETRKQCEAERLRAIEETKRKQWCAQCRQEANFYCCWNASYCGYTCQQMHWGKHTSICAQSSSTPSDLPGPSNSTVASSTMPSEQRHPVMASNCLSPLNSTVSCNNKTAISPLPTTINRKERGLAKNASSSHMMIATSSPAALSISATHSNNSQPAEVLQLPTNTTLTTVSRAPGSAQTLRCNTANSMPIQRFMSASLPVPVSLPMTTQITTSGGPHTFSTRRPTNSSWAKPVHFSNNNNARNLTVAAPIVNVPTADRSSNVKTQIRYI